ncbi:hypothetical protein Tco_1446210 [Tanacetum coccineum]
MQMQESKVVSSKALDASLVVTECSGTKSDEHITSSSSGTYITYVVDADIRPTNEQVSSVEVDSSTTPDSTNIIHRGGEIDHDAEQDQVKSPLLKAEFLKMNDMTKDHNDSLIAQVNSKTVENADLKARIQEKVFANAALKNELIKLNETSMDTKFAKPSILGNPVLQPHRNQSVVRQPNAFKSERPNFSKPQFASQVDVINILNNQEEYYGSNDMAHNHYLEEAWKKTQERNRNSKPSVMPSVRLQNTTDRSTPNPKRTSQTSRSFPTSKSSCVTIMVVPKADHSRKSSSFSDSKHFFCSTCHKRVFNANHDACIIKLLNEVNSHKVKPHKTKNSNNPVEQKSHTQKPGRWIPTGRIFKLAGLRWIPTRNMFIDNITKADSEPPNGSNKYITNPYECDQTLNVSAGTLNLSTGLTLQRQNDVCSHQFRPRSSMTK